MPTDWNLTPKEAIEFQNQLRDQVMLEPLKNKNIKYIGGADVSMSMFAKDGFAGFVTLSYDTLEMVGHSVVKDEIGFPYIPGLLSFREIPMLLKAWKDLEPKPDVLIVDGMGIAHPRRLGIATHLGLELGIPTIGCGKSLLTGTYEEPRNEPGDFSYLYDKFNKTEIIGAVLRSKKNVKPLIISPGHLITLDESIEIVRHCILRHRLPEPTRLAHAVMNEYRRKDVGI